MKIKAAFLLIITILTSVCLESDNFELIDEILAKDQKFILKKNQLEMERAKLLIENSSNWFNLNLSYKTGKNEIFRDEVETDQTENWNIKQAEEEWRIEIEKSFFQKDFDDTYDFLKGSIDKFRYESELVYFKLTGISKIFDEFIKFHKNEELLKIQSRELEILRYENLKLEKLYEENIISADKLIKNLEKIADLENDILQTEEILKIDQQDFYPELQKIISELMTSGSDADTISFGNKIDLKIANIEKKVNELMVKINFRKLYFYFPELNVSFSYNKKRNSQEWFESENLSFDRGREIEEIYPEAEFEISLPFNIFSNNIGKFRMLKALEKELRSRLDDLTITLLEFKKEAIFSYKKQKKQLHLAERIAEIEKTEFAKAQNVSQQSVLGNDQEINLEKQELKLDRAILKSKIEKMNFAKINLLIKYFNRENHEKK